ncbi:hypothetical protein, partial [Segatella copri]|uniref:hypothetical protein n=1 Tax=Segatella copri TaxID=165179 RepID=UPI001D1780A0
TCADGTAMQCGRVGSRLLSISEASITKVVGAFCFPTDLSFFFFPQISLMPTDFSAALSFYLFTFKSPFYPFTFLPFYLYNTGYLV